WMPFQSVVGGPEVARFPLPNQKPVARDRIVDGAYRTIDARPVVAGEIERGQETLLSAGGVEDTARTGDSFHRDGIADVRIVVPEAGRVPGIEEVAVDGKLRAELGEELRGGTRSQRAGQRGIAGRDQETQAGRVELDRNDVNDHRARRAANFAHVG